MPKYGMHSICPKPQCLYVKVTYLEKSNAKLGSTVSRLEAVQAENRGLKERAESVRTMEIENTSLLKDAKFGAELKERNTSMKLNVSLKSAFEGTTNCKLNLSSPFAQYSITITICISSLQSQERIVQYMYLTQAS